MEEERNVGSASGGKGLQLGYCLGRAEPTVDVRQRKKSRGGITGAATKPGARGYALVDRYLCAAFIVGKALGIESGRPIHDVLFRLEGYLRLAGDGQFIGRFDVQNVAKVDGHEDRFDIVVAIGPTAKNAQTEIDLGATGNGKRKERHVGTNIVHK